MRKSIIALICFTTVVAVAGCYYDKEDLLYHKTGGVDCTKVNAKFTTDVLPLMIGKCATAGCHDAATAAGGAVLETYTQISGLAGRINQRCIVDGTMPPGAPLTVSEIDILKCWINSGTPNN
jgi:uncharacterized membrane protein